MIPVIDIRDAIAGSAQRPTVDAIRHAAEDVGFFQIVGHGVPADLIDAAYRSADELMDLPESTKNQWTHPHPFRGWERRPRTGDLVIQQRLQVCDIGSAEDAAARGIDPRYHGYFQTNVWPEVPGLRASLEALIEAEKNLGLTLMSLFAQALDLPADHFTPFFEHQVSTFAINHYEGGHIHGDNTIALREHKDSGTLTILHQRGEYDGLEVLRTDGQFMTVPVRDDAFVINIGELMERWTNDRFIATRHRVLLPEQKGTRRTSLTLFQGPSIDTVIEPLSTCTGGEPPRYPPTTPFEWESQYFAKYDLAIEV